MVAIRWHAWFTGCRAAQSADPEAAFAEKQKRVALTLAMSSKPSTRPASTDMTAENAGDSAPLTASAGAGVGPGPGRTTTAPKIAGMDGMVICDLRRAIGETPSPAENEIETAVPATHGAESAKPHLLVQ